MFKNYERLIKVTIVPTLDTNPYADDDVLFTATPCNNSIGIPGSTSRLHAITIIDKDNTKQAFRLLFFGDNVDVGDISEELTISDEDIDKLTAYFDVDVSDYRTIGGKAIAFFGNLDIPLNCSPAHRHTYLAAKCEAVQTHTATGLTIILWVDWAKN